MKRVPGVILAALLALGTASLAATQQGNQGGQYAASSQSSGDQKSQQRITKEVRHELAMMPQLSIFDNLAFAVNGNTVTLLGQVKAGKSSVVNATQKTQ